MFRRQFMHRITLAGAGNVISRAAGRVTVTYRIKGFTCIACAVGLETMLRRQKGVLRVEASYPKATAHIEFDPSILTEESLKPYIAEMGFSAEP